MVLFVAPRGPLEQLAARWAEDCDESILRRCPICEQDSIIGHGRRQKQAHDEYHDWIGMRRGRCSNCGTTFTFLPLFSLPYTHFSLLARCQALWRRFQEHCSWEKAMPELKSADRLPDASTVRRWSEGVDESPPIHSILRKLAARVGPWLESAQSPQDHAKLLSWLTRVFEILFPMRC
jgi:hypothetical protein